MSAAAIVQLLSTCIGIIGSIFFAIGVMRQSIEAMAQLSGSYWDWNPHMPMALAQQKSDYLFGGTLIVAAFMLQLISYFFSSEPLLSAPQAKLAPWLAAGATGIAFVALRAASKRLAVRYESKIVKLLQARSKARSAA